ncbi:MAG: hypothetical protein U0Z75_03320 [Deinococcaceae bacterium]
MTRPYARGNRAISNVSKKRGKNFTLISALNLRAAQAEWVIEGAPNGQIFKTYIKEVFQKISP